MADEVKVRAAPSRPEASWLPQRVAEYKGAIHFTSSARRLCKGGRVHIPYKEYKAQHPESLEYIAFCDHLRAFLHTAEPVMRFEHLAVDKCFVDYAGQTAEVIDRNSGEIRQA